MIFFSHDSIVVSTCDKKLINRFIQQQSIVYHEILQIFPNVHIIFDNPPLHFMNWLVCTLHESRIKKYSENIIVLENNYHQTEQNYTNKNYNFREHIYIISIICMGIWNSELRIKIWHNILISILKFSIIIYDHSRYWFLNWIVCNLELEFFANQYFKLYVGIRNL